MTLYDIIDVCLQREVVVLVQNVVKDICLVKLMEEMVDVCLIYLRAPFPGVSRYLPALAN